MAFFDDEKWRSSAFNIICVFGFLMRGDSVLLIRRSNEPFKGMTTVPGGRKERGETTREACAREMREETGYIIDPSKAEFIGTLQAFAPGSPYDFISYYYIARDFSGEMATSDEGELVWTPFAESAGIPGIHPYYVAVADRIKTLRYPFDGSVRPGGEGGENFSFYSSRT